MLKKSEPEFMWCKPQISGQTKISFVLTYQHRRALSVRGCTAPIFPHPSHASGNA